MRLEYNQDFEILKWPKTVLFPLHKEEFKVMWFV
jgi:hypothetical protein